MTTTNEQRANVAHAPLIDDNCPRCGEAGMQITLRQGWGYGCGECSTVWKNQGRHRKVLPAQMARIVGTKFEQRGVVMLNLEDPSQAREYFDGLSFAGQKPLYVILPKNRGRLYFKDMSDEQVVEFAKTLAPDLEAQLNGRRGRRRLS